MIRGNLSSCHIYVIIYQPSLYAVPKENFEFKSPDTGGTSPAENPVNEIIQQNALFIEKLKQLNGLKNFGGIQQLFYNAGRQEFNKFEAVMHEAGLTPEDLLKLEKKPPAIRDDAERWIKDFFQTNNEGMRKSLISHLAQLLK